MRCWRGTRRWIRARARHHHRAIHSLRAKLTLVNVCVLTLGIVAATAVSLMGMRHYLLDRVDSELMGSRTALQQTGFTQKEIETISAIGELAAQFGRTGRAACRAPTRSWWPSTRTVSRSPRGRRAHRAPA